jgi:hypothetical protein
MLRQFALSTLFLILFPSCDNKEMEKTEQMKMVVYFYSSIFQDRIDTSDVLIKRIDSTNFIYKSKPPDENKWSFELKFELKDTIKVLTEGNWNKIDEVYKFIDRKGFKLYYYGNSYYFVYKILNYSYAIDSEGLIFWSPEFGIILERSLTWRSFARFEYLNDESKNEIIRHLCFSIMNDKEFYNQPDWRKNIN